MRKPRLVAFTGAGISAESGLRTFRDSNGLWEEYRIEEVATPEAWQADREKVLHFYDLRRHQVLNAQPNAAHLALAGLEDVFHVDVVTQNIDDLHERAGSTRILHLHGEIMKARSTADPRLVIPLNGPSLKIGDACPLGSQLRPHIVWFGEDVPLIPSAIQLVMQAEIFIIIGTSLNVYPAAGLIQYVPSESKIFIIDPGSVPSTGWNAEHIRTTASKGTPLLAARLREELNDR